MPRLVKLLSFLNIQISAEFCWILAENCVAEYQPKKYTAKWKSTGKNK